MFDYGYPSDRELLEREAHSALISAKARDPERRRQSEERSEADEVTRMFAGIIGAMRFNARTMVYEVTQAEVAMQLRGSSQAQRIVREILGKDSPNAD